ncbi:hypothetical protein RO3G_10108 [Lichtheimia corymbifera JMRC:FSU:9682]|uniref:MHD domain-containing protein n=1 Tax=Lichtheimia corymbifera JMRC:FSU:9682 TaxID=1263082 RepID=A0A068S6N7_9FUNG|nr:hypothetical protein RO3G_10108 [Lichtheimia corymbifera JMRC:FSU:9682]
MAEESSNNPYVDTFLTARPKDGIDAVQERLRTGRLLDEELAQYFRERAQIEDQYAKSLVKASKKLFITDKTILGNFAPVWDLLYNEFTETSTAHAVLSYKIADEIEKPLRNPPVEYNKAKSMEPTFQRLAKEYDENAKKRKKTGDKGTLFKRSNKDSGASKRNMESASSQWMRDGPEYLMHHQLLEESRLQRLKALVEQFSQLQTDQMMKRMEIANVTMSAASAFDVQSELEQFCQSRGHGMAKASATTSASIPHSESRRHSLDGRQSSNGSYSQVSEPEMARPPSKTSRVRSTFSIRRKTRNGSATRLPDTPSIAEEPSRGSYYHADANSSRASHSSRGNISNPSTPPAQMPASTSLQPSEQSQTQQTPQVDSEGYSIPPPDRSAYTMAVQDDNASFDTDSASLQTGQRLKIDIRNDAIQKENDPEAHAALNRMSTLLRDRTPSISRRPRGRRDNTRSMQIDPGHGNTNKNDDAIVQGSSVISSASTTPTNPFHQNSFDLSTPSSQSPTLSHDIPSSNQLQSITETGQSQIYASIVEIVERDPQADDSVRVTGHIKLVYNGSTALTDPLLLRLHSPSKEAMVKPNPTFVEPWQQGDDPEIYRLKPEAFENYRRTPVPCFAYQLQTSSSVLPMQLSPAWKCTPDASYLIVKHKMADDVSLSKSQLAVCVKFDQATVTNVQSTPQGAWDVSRKQLTWTNEAILQSKDASKLLAKFITSEQGSPVPVALKYYCKDVLVSGAAIEAVPAYGSTLQIKQVQQVVKSDKVYFAP